MKATGIVRRIDDLGRVVIPKEIRRTLRIREGDPLEIYTDNSGEVILKKYSMVGELSTFAQEYVDSLFLSAKITSVICDRENIVAASTGDKKELMDKKISKDLDKIISKRQLVTSLNGEVDIVKDKKNEHKYAPAKRKPRHSKKHATDDVSDSRTDSGKLLLQPAPSGTDTSRPEHQ